MDKNEKKKAWKEEQRRKARSEFPLPETELNRLFEYVESEVEKLGCDHTYKLTSLWLQEKGHADCDVMPWLKDTGGYCDCEVAANSFDHFIQNKESV